MNRRNFIQASTLLSLGLGLESFITRAKTHILTLSFDDGFKKSFFRIAEIHEEYGLKSCLNVIASGHLPGFKAVGQWILPELMGDFVLWNSFKSRGHEIMPHSWDHLNLTEIPLEEAKPNINKCLDYFEKHLEGYVASDAVYNFAFNSSTPELDEFTLKRVRAVRTGGWLVLKETMVNQIPPAPTPLRLGCWSRGPDCCDAYVEEEVNKFLAGPGGWMILNVHGLDEEGWGPLTTKYLDLLLKRLVKIEYVDVLPTGEVLKK